MFDIFMHRCEGSFTIAADTLKKDQAAKDKKLHNEQKSTNKAVGSFHDADAFLRHEAGICQPCDGS